MCYFLVSGKKKTRPSFLKLHNHKFIAKLIQHILPPQFRVIKYYGILANCVRNKYQKIISKIIGQIKKILPLFNWRKRQLKFKGTDSLACNICGRDMVLTEIAFPSRFGGLAYKFF
ncbi:transposase [bacterium]|nr:transposase [bacterium]